MTLVAHIVSGGAWIGIDVVVGAIVLAGWLTADPAIQGAAYVALGSFVVGPMLVSGLVCLASGLVLGLGTRYGLVRYWWVAIKLVMNLVLCVLIVFLLQPGMPEIVEHGRSLLAGTGSDAKEAAVTIVVDDNGVNVRVTNPGRFPPPTGTGRGLAGMRRRIEATGGRFDAGPDDREFGVEAHIPYVGDR